MAGWTAAAIVGTSLIGADAAGDAASAQAGASAASSAAQERMTDKQIAAQKEAMERQIALQEPWRQSGIAAQNRLLQLLGLKSGGTYEQYRQQLLPQYTRTTTPTPVAAAPAQRTGFGVNVRGRAARAAAQDATPRMIQVPVGPAAPPGNEQQMAWIVDPTWTQEQAAKTTAAAPVTTIDEAALDKAIRARMAEDKKNGTGPDFGKYARDFSMADFEADPGYAFRLSEGQKALERSAAARGGLISGAALKATQRFGQDYGSQEYTNAFNRYQTNRANQLQPLQSLAGVGQTATNQMGSAVGNYGAGAGAAYGNLGSAIGANEINAGNARASAYVGQANAINQGLGTYLNYTQNQNMMNMLAQNRTGSPAGYGTLVADPYGYTG